MKIKLILWSIICLFFSSCSNNIYVKRNDVRADLVQEINYLGARKTGEIKIGENEYFKVKNIKISNDTLFYMDPFTKINSILYIGEINVVQFNDHFIGTIYGLFTGFGFGVFVGLVTIDPDSEIPGLTGLGYTTAGGLIGSISGGVIGVKRKYIFTEDK